MCVCFCKVNQKKIEAHFLHALQSMRVISSILNDRATYVTTLRGKSEGKLITRGESNDESASMLARQTHLFKLRAVKLHSDFERSEQRNKLLQRDLSKAESIAKGLKIKNSGRMCSRD